MPTLAQSLKKHDLVHLRILAEIWGVELSAGERDTARDELSEKLLNETLVAEVIEALPVEARDALTALLQNQGRIPWAKFARQYGEVREVGAGRRDREEIHLAPVSAAETLFYRALLARAFFDHPSGAQEFAYLPDDLLRIIQGEEGPTAPVKLLGRLARPGERAHIILATDHILDDLTTLLAALRLGWEKPPFDLETSLRFARDLLPAARLMKDNGELQTDSIKIFLENERKKALDQLTQIWRESETINELHQTPTLICEGAWVNPVLDTRRTLLGFLETIPKNKWWSLKSFIADIKNDQPDFQRTAGDYDAWFIRRANDGSRLRGFEDWDGVEGALIRYFITGPLYWLGMVDLASANEDGEATAFRVREKRVEGKKEEREKINLNSSGQIIVNRHLARTVRYQLSRFCNWEKGKNPDEYRYQITPSSLERAREQGLKISHLLGLLGKFATGEIPPSLSRALQRWEVNGTEARVERVSVLRLSKPEDLKRLRESKAGRFLGEVLGPTAVIVQAGASSKIMAALIEMGIFMKDEEEKQG